MRLGAKSIGGWVGCVGASNNLGGSSNLTHIIKICGINRIAIHMGVLYFSIATYL